MSLEHFDMQVTKINTDIDRLRGLSNEAISEGTPEGALKAAEIMNEISHHELTLKNIAHARSVAQEKIDQEARIEMAAKFGPATEEAEKHIVELSRRVCAAEQALASFMENMMAADRANEEINRILNPFIKVQSNPHIHFVNPKERRNRFRNFIIQQILKYRTYPEEDTFPAKGIVAGINAFTRRMHEDMSKAKAQLLK